MAKYIISSQVTLPIGKGQGTLTNPFDLSVGEGFESIEHIDLNGGFAKIPNPTKTQETSYNSLISIVDNKGGGGLTNTDLDRCFQYANITAFTVNCPNITSTQSMFNTSYLVNFNSEMPNLENGDHMFSQTSVGFTSTTSHNEANFFFPKLKTANYMFYWRMSSNIEEETLKFKAPLLEEAEGMFYQNHSTTKIELTTNQTMAEKDADYFELPSHDRNYSERICYRWTKTLSSAEDGLIKVVFDKLKKYSFTVTTEWMKQTHPATYGRYDSERFCTFPVNSARDSDLTMYWNSVDEIVYNGKTPQEWLEEWANSHGCDAELCIWSGNKSPLDPEEQPDQIITYKYNK